MNIKKIKEHYIKHYGSTEEILYSYCPYRICPLGAHVDHQHGLVTGFALNFGIGIAYSINEDDLCQVVSHNFEKRKRFRVTDVLEKQNDWCDYIRGGVKSLQRNGYSLKRGINAYIYGELPVGGLSSSAANIISFLIAIANANGFTLSNQELIEYAFQAETEFVGMSIGKLDQSCEVLSKKNKLLVLDTNTGEYKTVELGKDAKPFEFLVVHCGAERLLAGSYYNVRVDECKSAAFITNSYLEVYKKFKDTYLRDLDYNDFLKYENKMPKNFAKRAHHFYNECNRVIRGEEAWAKGDIVEFGKIVSESGKSSIEMYEAGSPLLIDLYNIMVNTKGVYGSRFMGGGFNGACLAIIDPQFEKEVMENIKNEYSKLHPEYADKVKLFICTSEDGVGK